MVAETETKISGWSAAQPGDDRSLADRGRPGEHRESSAGRGSRPRRRRAGRGRRTPRSARPSGACPRPAQPPVGGDVQALHHLGRPDRADPGQRPEHVDHLGVGDDVVLSRRGSSTSARVRSPDRRACLISARRRRAWVAALLGLLTLLVAQRGDCHWSRPSLPIRGLRTYPKPRTAFISPSDPRRRLDAQGGRIRTGGHHLPAGRRQHQWQRGWPEHLGQVVGRPRPGRPGPAPGCEPLSPEKSTPVRPMVAPTTSPTEPRRPAGLRRGRLVDDHLADRAAVRGPARAGTAGPRGCWSGPARRPRGPAASASSIAPASEPKPR